MTPLDESRKPGGAIFPKSIWRYVPHLRQISSITEEETRGKFDEDSGDVLEWFEHLTDDLSVGNPTLFELVRWGDYDLPYHEWARLVGTWVFALQQEYRRHDAELPLILPFDLNPMTYGSAVIDLVREVGSSDSLWCMTYQEAVASFSEKKTQTVLVLLCQIAFMLDLAIETDFVTTCGTTPRSD